jgi:hypothetical protein
MKTLRFPVLLLWITIVPAAHSQQNGVVDGRIVNGTDPSIVARDADLEVIELTAGMRIIKTATADASGRFRIEGLPENHRLMIRATYKAANYYAQVSFDSVGKASVEIEVFEPTASIKEIRVEGVQMAFQAVGDQLKSLETITFNNKTKPPKIYMNPEGNFRFSKPPGIFEVPKIRVTAPGSSMPLVQAALESPDGQSYYTLYPLRPGSTSFEVQQILPYTNRSYTYVQRFYQDVGPIDIGVTPQDLALSGQGLSKIQTDSQRNFAVYLSGPVKAGSELVWTFSGGTPFSEPESSETAGNSTVTSMPGSVGRNALVIGPLLLLGFVLVLWYAFNHFQNGPQKASDLRTRRLKERREQLLNFIADLDYRYETNSIDRQEFLKKREVGKRRLRRISMFLRES